MNIRTQISDCLLKGIPFVQGNYKGIVDRFDSPKMWVATIYYYGSPVFKFISGKDETHKYDFCGYEGYSRTTKLINYCLEYINAKYRVSCRRKGKNPPEKYLYNIIEVPVKENV